MQVRSHKTHAAETHDTAGRDAEIEFDLNDPLACEQALAQPLIAGDEPRALALFEAIGREHIEFSCRCFALAITQGMDRAALAFARAGFHLAVTDEPAIAQRIKADGGMRGLLGFMSDYRSCKVQRTYYLPVAQSPLSLKPIRRLARERLLSAKDQGEILTLALRHGNAGLAHALVEEGADLPSDMHEGVPDALKQNARCERDAENRWLDFASPLMATDVLELVLEHVGSQSCAIPAAWFSSYARDGKFPTKLGMIVGHADPALCEDVPALLEILAGNGQTKALRTALDWDGVDAAALDRAYAAAQKAGNAEAAALVVRAQGGMRQTLADLVL